MAVRHVDDNAMMTFERVDGVWTTLQYRWEREVSDAAGHIMRTSEFDQIDIDTLSPAVQARLTTLFGDIVSRRDTDRPLT